MHQTYYRRRAGTGFRGGKNEPGRFRREQEVGGRYARTAGQSRREEGFRHLNRFRVVVDEAVEGEVHVDALLARRWGRTGAGSSCGRERFEGGHQDFRFVRVERLEAVVPEAGALELQDESVAGVTGLEVEAKLDVSPRAGEG